jgi:hypothetical protein
MAVHCFAVRQTSAAKQSASVAATHAFMASVHLPAKAHCEERRQSPFSFAMQRPFSA